MADNDQDQDKDKVTPDADKGAAGDKDKGADDAGDADKDKDADKADDFVDDDSVPEGSAPADKPQIKDKAADDTDDDADDDEDLSPEDKKKIDKYLAKKLDPVTSSVHSQRVETELSQILAANPEYKPYEAKIRRFVNHENRSGLIKQGLPVKTVVLEALAPHLQQIGVAKAKAADEKAARTRVDGSSSRPDAPGKLPDFTTKTAAEIEDIAEQVKRGTYNKAK